MRYPLLRRRLTADTGSLLVAALTACAVGVLWAFVAANVHQMQRADFEKARDDSRRVASQVESDIARTFEVAITALLRAADQIGRADSINRFARVLADLRPAHPEIASLALADSTGRGHAVTREGVHAYDARDGEAFRYLAANAVHEAYLTLPFRGGQRNVPQVAVARRLENGAGDFDGIIAVTLDYAFVERMLQDERLGPNGTIALHRLDKTLFARAANLPVPVGRSTADAAVWRQYPLADEGLFEVASSAVDGKRRIVAFRRVRNLPLLAVATLAQP
ncbi:MAG: cache domain-containing protein, partial [Rhodospirillales bacterium]|nr:cache domain-containing protein [Rhodospirillales bacterium]